MSAMPSSAIRRVPRWQYAGFGLALLIGISSLALGVGSSWQAYSYLLGTPTTVTVTDPCDDNDTTRSTWNDDCRGSWTLNGSPAGGKVHLPGEADQFPARPYAITASVRDGEAYVMPNRVHRLASIAAPWLFLLSVLVFAALCRIDDRRERRRKAAWLAWKAGRET